MTEKIYFVGDEYCEQFEPLMRSMEPSIALIRAAKCERESQ